MTAHTHTDATTQAAPLYWQHSPIKIKEKTIRTPTLSCGACMRAHHMRTQAWSRRAAAPRRPSLPCVRATQLLSKEGRSGGRSLRHRNPCAKPSR